MYRSIRRNIMINSLKGKHYDMFNKNEESWDLIINTSCEHMFPMKKWKRINHYSLDNLRGFKHNPYYILQSTSDDKWEDHINCVESADQLAEQAELTDILFSGSKILDNGLERFMVIGR